MAIKDKSLKLGLTGTGQLQNVVNGVSGDISIIIGEEKPGFGLTINQTETVDKFDHTYFIEIFLDKLFFYYLKFYFFVP